MHSMRHRLARLSIALPLLAALLPATAHAQAGPSSTATRPLEVIVFPGGFNLPIWVAQDRGFFQANGIAIKVTPTPTSVFQMKGLLDGTFDIAMTAMDNLVAYREGQGEEPGVQGDVMAVMGGDRGFLKLVAQPDIPSIAALRDKTLSVDARNTGYALVLFELLDRAGLREPDFSIERSGGVVQRFNALMEKKHAATMLVSPFELRAVPQGYKVLATASTELGAYQGYVAGVRQSWAAANGPALTAYIRSYVQGVDWLLAPGNRNDVIAILQKNVPNTSDADAQKIYDVLVDPKTGFQKRAALDAEGLAQVLALRSKWGVPKKTLRAPETYYDPRFYEAAVK
jgi:ABC-type nitrate/sulfonate/bicarbonate transport system substrate-binding protein